MEEKYKVEETEEEYILKVPKEKNYTLQDLKQNLINTLYKEINSCEKIDGNKVELLKELL